MTSADYKVPGTSASHSGFETQFFTWGTGHFLLCLLFQIEEYEQKTTYFWNSIYGTLLIQTTVILDRLRKNTKQTGINPKTSLMISAASETMCEGKLLRFSRRRLSSSLVTTDMRVCVCVCKSIAVLVLCPDVYLMHRELCAGP